VSVSQVGPSLGGFVFLPELPVRAYGVVVQMPSVKAEMVRPTMAFLTR
jgi:hypothetical protein